MHVSRPCITGVAATAISGNTCFNAEDTWNTWICRCMLCSIQWREVYAVCQCAPSFLKFFCQRPAWQQSCAWMAGFLSAHSAVAAPSDVHCCNGFGRNGKAWRPRSSAVHTAETYHWWASFQWCCYLAQPCPYFCFQTCYNNKQKYDRLHDNKMFTSEDDMQIERAVSPIDRCRALRLLT